MTDIKSLAQEAEDAFWQVVVRHFPQATTGDLSIDRTIRLSLAAEEAIKEWIANNVTTQQKDLAVGYRFKLVRSVERFPSFLAKAGMTGTVIESSPTTILARMDQHLDGAEEWDNCIQWHDYGDPDYNERLEFSGDTEAA